MFEAFKHASMTLDGIEIAYVIGGAGPPLLLLHGYPQCKALWARVAPKLAAHFTVVCADLRGYGDSTKPPCAPDKTNYSFRAMAGDQIALMHALGYARFQVAGHDRGARTAYRMALDHPDAVQALALLDIVPTYSMFMDTNRRVAAAYWHWYFLSQPEPFPERLIAADPDYFYENCLLGWGAAKISDFNADMLAEYRRCWRDPGMIHGSCADYRAASTVDLILDTQDADRIIDVPTLVFFGANGQMAQLFDIPAEWRRRCSRIETASLPGGHFFVDQFPDAVATILDEFFLRDKSDLLVEGSIAGS
jgi:haloacetate dehalogenase